MVTGIDKQCRRVVCPHVFPRRNSATGWPTSTETSSAVTRFCVVCESILPEFLSKIYRLCGMFSFKSNSLLYSGTGPCDSTNVPEN